MMARQRGRSSDRKNSGRNPSPGRSQRKQSPQQPSLDKVVITKDSAGYVRSDELPHWSELPEEVKGRYPTGTSNRSSGIGASVTYLTRHNRPSAGPWHLTQPELDRWVALVGRDRVVQFLATGVPADTIEIIKKCIGSRKFSSLTPMSSACMSEVFHRGYPSDLAQQILTVFVSGSSSKMFPTTTLSSKGAGWSHGLMIDTFLNLVDELRSQSRVDALTAAQALSGRYIPRISKMVDTTDTLVMLDGSQMTPDVLGDNLTILSKSTWSQRQLKIWMSLPIHEKVMVDAVAPLLGNASLRDDILDHLKVGFDAGVPADWLVEMLKK